MRRAEYSVSMEVRNNLVNVSRKMVARTETACVPKNRVTIPEKKYKNDLTNLGHLENIFEYPTEDRNMKRGLISTKKMH